MRPRGTPPTPSAMSSGSAPVGDRLDLDHAAGRPGVISGALRRTPSRSGHSAACSAWSRAFASFSPASLRLGFCICHLRSPLCLGHVGGRKLQLSHRFVLGAGRPQVGPEEHQTGRTEEPNVCSGSGPGGLPTTAGLRAARAPPASPAPRSGAARRGASPARRSRAATSRRSTSPCSATAPSEGPSSAIQPRALAARHADRLGEQLHLRRESPRPRAPPPRSARGPSRPGSRGRPASCAATPASPAAAPDRPARAPARPRSARAPPPAGRAPRTAARAGS